MNRWVARYSSLLVAIGAAILVGFAATPSMAQCGGGDACDSGVDLKGESPYIDALSKPIRSVTPSRLNTMEERRQFNALDLERRRLEMDEGEIRQDIGLQLQTAGVTCGVKGFKRVGTTPDAQSIYEAACDSGPGYVLVNGVEPRATNCLVLAGAASTALRRDPNAPTGAQCSLPENQNGVELIGGWARQAGLACKVDQAEWLGSDDGVEVYEVGCEASEGFWLEQAASGWSLRGCLQVASEGLTCRFTDQNEQNAWMRARLAGTSAAGCDVAETRMIGVSRDGNHYEARCSTPGQGYLVRIAGQAQAEDVTPCGESDDGPSGCALTTGRSDG